MKYFKTFESFKLNEISTKAGLDDVIKGRTSAIEGIPMSKDMADALKSWIGSSPYGRKYGKQINKGRIASLIGPANAFGIERYLDSKGKKEWKEIYKKFGPKRESEELNEKDYSTEQRKEMAEKGLALPDGRFPIANVEDLKNAILSYGRSKDHSEVAKFIAKRAKALGAEDLIPDTENFQKALKEVATRVPARTIALDSDEEDDNV
jgi:hypothetical protein